MEVSGLSGYKAPPCADVLLLVAVSIAKYIADSIYLVFRNGHLILELPSHKFDSLLQFANFKLQVCPLFICNSVHHGLQSPTRPMLLSPTADLKLSSSSKNRLLSPRSAIRLSLNRDMSGMEKVALASLTTPRIP